MITKIALGKERHTCPQHSASSPLHVFPVILLSYYEVEILEEKIISSTDRFL